MHFLDFIAQRANISGLKWFIIGIQDDFLNLGASVAKIDFLFSKKDDPTIKFGISRMVSTEVEYIFSLCRSIFDLLAEIISVLWENIKLIDDSIKKKPLKKSFNDMVFFGGNPETEEHLISRFGLPQPMASFYIRNARFFELLRSFRDKIVHGGTTMPKIFSTEKGFAVSENTLPFSEFNVWTDEHKQLNGLCSLRPVIGHVIKETIATCEDFSQTMEKVIKCNEPIAPELHLLLRGYHNSHLIMAVRAATTSSWWDQEEKN